MPEPTSPCPAATCVDCQTWLGLPGMSVARVADVGTEGLVVHIESVPGPVGCPHCGVMATGHGRDEVVLVDAPSFGRPVRLGWAKRRHVCREDLCPGGSFTEQDPAVAPPRGRLTTRAVSWAVDEVRGEHASISGLARRLGWTGTPCGTLCAPTWKRWRPTRPGSTVSRCSGSMIPRALPLQAGGAPSVWHHVDPRTCGPRMLTGMVDLTRDQDGRTRARLLDLVPRAFWRRVRGVAH